MLSKTSVKVHFLSQQIFYVSSSVVIRWLYSPSRLFRVVFGMEYQVILFSTLYFPLWFPLNSLVYLFTCLEGYKVTLLNYSYKVTLLTYKVDFPIRKETKVDSSYSCKEWCKTKHPTCGFGIPSPDMDPMVEDRSPHD
jgi:hypothetical protein